MRWSDYGTICLALLLLWASCLDTTMALATDEVKGLLGQPPVSFKHYAGHVSIAQNQCSLFYWFFEADHADAAQLPLAVWFNGGPGCSSVGNDALFELGPFAPTASTYGLVINHYSWTKEANIVFVESPSRKFPQHKTNDFYLLGESYASHYIPSLARLIVQRNKGTQLINFKGFAIGNPWMDAEMDNAGTTDFYRSHSLISDETNCDYAKELPVDATSNSTLFNQAVEEADIDMAQINIYNIYAVSSNANKTSKAKGQFRYRLTTAYADPCIDIVTSYLNRPEVQNAVHASDSPVFWSGCSSVVYSRYKREDIVASMLPVYRELVQ